MNAISLCAGIDFHYIPAGKFKTSVICVLIRSRLHRETATITALIPAILKSGCQKYKTRAEINAAAEAMYGAIFDIHIVKKGEEQIIQFYIEYVNFINSMELCESAIRFLMELMLNPLIENEGFSAEYTNCEKQNLKAAIEGRINIKTEYAKLRCVEHMCQDEGFGVYADGYAEDIENIDEKKAYAHYTELLLESPIEFIVSGNDSEAYYRELIKSIFISNLNHRLKPSIASTNIPKASYKSASRPVRRIKENLGLAQCKLCMGFRAGIDPVSPDFITLMVFNELLGGMSNSRLFTEIREKRGLCYYISSFVFRFKSILFVQSGVDDEALDKTEKLVTEHIKQISTGQITERELADAKKSLKTTYRRIFDNQGQQIEFSFAQHMLGDSMEISELIDRIYFVNDSDCARVAGALRLDTVYSLN